jgi:hypothetical protein
MDTAPCTSNEPTYEQALGSATGPSTSSEPTYEQALGSATAGEGGSDEDPDIALARLLQEQEHAWFVANGGSLNLSGSVQGNDQSSAGPSRNSAHPPEGYACKSSCFDNMLSACRG